MRTAIDTNVLLDLLGDTPAAESSQAALAAVSAEGVVTVCPVVQAELAANLGSEEALERFVEEFRLSAEPFLPGTLIAAGSAFRLYSRSRGQQIQCPRCGRRFALECPSCGTTIAWRQHVIADFLIGTHALRQADRLLTRDAGYYRAYFPELKLLVPGESTS